MYFYEDQMAWKKKKNLMVRKKRWHRKKNMKGEIKEKRKEKWGQWDSKLYQKNNLLDQT
jgi:hypothetical protein